LKGIRRGRWSGGRKKGGEEVINVKVSLRHDCEACVRSTMWAFGCVSEGTHVTHILRRRPNKKKKGCIGTEIEGRLEGESTRDDSGIRQRQIQALCQV
jgi:hypothetical protein